jgi:hypothetical protein
MSPDDWRHFESYVNDLQGARDNYGKMSAELLEDIFKAGCFLRLQFERPDWPAGQARYTGAGKIDSV